MKKILAFLCMLLASFSFAQEDNFDEQKMILLHEIISNRINCVKELKKNKIYLMEDKVYTTHS